MKTTKITLNMPTELLKQIDLQAEELYTTRTALIVNALVRSMQAEKIMNSLLLPMPNLSELEK